MRNKIYHELKELGFGPGEDGMEDFFTLWRSWYEGDVPHFHRYRVYNGQKRVLCRRASLGMAKKVCEDWANLLMNEKVHIRLDGEEEQRFLNRVLEENNFRLQANRMQERKAALGTAAYVPRICGDRICIDCIDAEGIFPLSWENGEITECAFAAESWEGGEHFIILQIHHVENGEYVIEHMLFVEEDGSLTRLPNSLSEALRGVPERLPTGRSERSFVIDRMNSVNNLDAGSPMGLAAFANAIDQLRGVDVAYDSYVNEFILGKKRIMVKPEATKDFDGEPLFDADDLAFYILPEDSDSGSIIREIDMSLRTKEHHQGLQDMLNMLGVKCGFGERYYRFESGGLKTATEVISENSSLYRSVRRHELMLEAALKELARLLLRMGKDFLRLELDEKVPIHIDFDDSIIEDTGSDFERDCRMLQLGVLEKEEFRKRWVHGRHETERG